MAAYGPYTTTVVGSDGVPRWYEVLEKQVESGALSANDMKDVQSFNVEKSEQIAERITRYG